MGTHTGGEGQIAAHRNRKDAQTHVHSPYFVQSWKRNMDKSHGCSAHTQKPGAKNGELSFPFLKKDILGRHGGCKKREKPPFNDRAQQLTTSRKKINNIPSSFLPYDGETQKSHPRPNAKAMIFHSIGRQQQQQQQKMDAPKWKRFQPPSPHFAKSCGRFLIALVDSNSFFAVFFLACSDSGDKEMALEFCGREGQEIPGNLQRNAEQIAVVVE